MGVLDNVLGGLLGNQGGASSPLGQVLSSLLGGQGGPGMGANMPGGTSGGGLGGLLAQFQRAGLSNVAQSWINNGPNQSVSPSQLQDVFGQNQVQSMAGQAGMAPGDFLSQLSQHLPSAVDRMTPNGTMPPTEGSVSV